MKFGSFGSEKCGGFLVANCLSIFPRKNRLKLCHRKFTTFFTARKDNCRLELTLGACSPNTLAQTIASQSSVALRKKAGLQLRKKKDQQLQRSGLKLVVYAGGGGLATCVVCTCAAKHCLQEWCCLHKAHA